MSMMRWAIALMVLATPAKAQDADALHRAAYCIGVLKSDLQYMASPDYEAQTAAEAKVLCDISKSDCHPLKERIEKAVREVRAKHDRYVRYVATRTGGKQSSLLLAVTTRGEREGGLDSQKQEIIDALADCANQAYRPDTAVEKVMKSMMDCLSQRDQSLANRFACRSMPDRLPF